MLIMVEKVESGLIDSFYHCYVTYFVLPEGQKQVFWLMITLQVRYVLLSSYLSISLLVLVYSS